MLEPLQPLPFPGSGGTDLFVPRRDTQRTVPALASPQLLAKFCPQPLTQGVGIQVGAGGFGPKQVAEWRSLESSNIFYRRIFYSFNFSVKRRAHYFPFHLSP